MNTNNMNTNNIRTSIKEIKDYGATWYCGKESLDACLTFANSKKNTFIVAFDYWIEGMEKPTKVYGSYKNANTFNNKTRDIEIEQRCFYVVIPENTKCCLFGDLEWSLNWKTVDEIKNKFIQIVLTTLKEANINDVKEKDFLFSNASNIVILKGSLHVHLPKIIFDNIKEQQKFFNAVYRQLTEEWFFIDQSEKQYIEKTFIDFSVYNKNRQIRLPYCSKKNQKNKEIGIRPLIPENEDDFDITEWCITDLSHAGSEEVNLEEFPSDIICAKRKQWSKSLIQGIIDQEKIPVTIHTLNNNLITLKNKTKNRLCMLSDTIHENNNSYLTIKNNQLNYHCHSETCKDKHKVIYTFENKEKFLYNEPPFKKHYMEYQKNKDKFIITKDKDVIITEAFYKFRNDCCLEINSYTKIINGGEKMYVLYRVNDGKNTSWFSKFNSSFLETYQEYNVFIGITCIFGPNYWLKKYTNKEKFIKEDCRPYENPNDCLPTTFNTYMGFDITKEIALEKGSTDSNAMTIILDFLLKSWAQNDQGLFNWILDFMANILQKPYIKMKVCLVLQGREGAGKGMIIQLLASIIGQTHFFQPSSPEDIFGTFNSMMDNKLFCFLDEMFWGGNKSDTGKLKKLLTENVRGSNVKYGPMRRMSNLINWVMASNEEWIVPAGSGARRYTVVKVNDDLLYMNEADKKALYSFCPFTFANFLYNRDISKFNPHKHYKTNALRDQKILSMPPVDKFWLSKFDNIRDFGGNRNKKMIYEEFINCASTTYKISDKAFWLASENIFGKWKSTRRQIGSSVTRVTMIQVPPLEELIIKFNIIYDCEMYESPEIIDDDDSITSHSPSPSPSPSHKRLIVDGGIGGSM